jgi:hypothetical protein
MSLFVISALRAVVEMLGCCLIGQATSMFWRGRDEQATRSISYSI